MKIVWRCVSWLTLWYAGTTHAARWHGRGLPNRKGLVAFGVGHSDSMPRQCRATSKKVPAQDEVSQRDCSEGISSTVWGHVDPARDDERDGTMKTSPFDLYLTGPMSRDFRALR